MFRFPALFLPALSLLFSSLALAGPIDDAVSRVRAVALRGGTPVVVSDLDETLVDSSARKFFSYRQAFDEACGTDRSGNCAIAAGVNLEELLALPNRYDLDSLFHKLGIPPGDWLKSVTNRAFAIYLSGKYLELDQATPGATEFVQALRKAGAEVFYVTARFDDTQRAGTLASLRELGMLEGVPEDHVILRGRGTSSIDFKKKSFESIQAWAAAREASVELVMENEPENMNAMEAAFPGAKAIFVDGAWTKAEPIVPEPVHVRDFR